MKYLALHYYRLLPATTVTYAVGSTLIPTGWYNLPTFLAAIRAGAVVTISWTRATGLVNASAAFTLSNTYAQSLIGWSDASIKDGVAFPSATWSPGNVEYRQEYAPCLVAGKRRWDTEYYQAQSGETWALGAVSVYTERFSFDLVRKETMFADAGTTEKTKTFTDVVFEPSLGICFELVYLDSVDCGAGYVQGGIWCHVADPESAIQMPPWDLHYTMSLEANKYVVP